jgi:hypothetical protein
MVETPADRGGDFKPACMCDVVASRADGPSGSRSRVRGPANYPEMRWLQGLHRKRHGHTGTLPKKSREDCGVKTTTCTTIDSAVPVRPFHSTNIPIKVPVFSRSIQFVERPRRSMPLVRRRREHLCPFPQLLRSAFPKGVRFRLHMGRSTPLTPMSESLWRLADRLGALISCRPGPMLDVGCRCQSSKRNTVQSQPLSIYSLALSE